VKDSPYQVKTLTLSGRLHERERSSPPSADAPNASRSSALHTECAKAIREEYGNAYIAGFGRTARFLISRGVPPGHAEELSQAAWVRGWERLHQLRGESGVSTWVNTIALNLFRNELRREKSAEPLAKIQSSFRMDTASIDIGRILSYCRPSERTLLEHQLDGATMDEVARVFGVTGRAIRLRLLRARRAVRARLEQRAATLRVSSALASVGANRQLVVFEKP
jgi:RNA polymerase sigma factor (sigma-70 family)